MRKFAWLCGLPALAILSLLWWCGCASPGLVKQWERQVQLPIENKHFVVYTDEELPRAVGLEVLSALEFARSRTHQALGHTSPEKTVCNLYGTESKLRQIAVGLPLGLAIPRTAPLAYVQNGEIHGRLYTSPEGNLSRLWVSTFVHEYCHVIFKEITGHTYHRYGWLQEGLAEYFRRLYLQEQILAPTAPQMRAVGRPETGLPDNDIQLALDSRLLSYTDWELRDGLRYADLPTLKQLNPATFVGYWRWFGGTKANRVYASAASAVEYLVTEFGWEKMQELLLRLREDSNLNRALNQVYGFDMAELENRWLKSIEARWPEPWEPDIPLVYTVRGEWEIDGHHAGIRVALEGHDLEAARRHKKFLNSRSIGGLDPTVVAPISHGLCDLEEAGQEGFQSRGISVFPLVEDSSPPTLELFESALAAYSIGEFAEGVRDLEEALAIVPEQRPELRLHLARGLWLSGRQDEAVELYREELAAEPQDEVLNEIAWCFEQTGHDQEAARLYSELAKNSEIAGLRARAAQRLVQIKT